MITASVQHASQMVEIQGAPLASQPPAAGVGKEFRITFAASIEENATAGKAQAAVAVVAQRLPRDVRASSGQAASRQVQSDLPDAGNVMLPLDEDTASKNSESPLGQGRLADVSNLLAAGTEEKHPTAGTIKVPTVATRESTGGYAGNLLESSTKPDDAAHRVVAGVPVTNVEKVNQRRQAIERAEPHDRQTDTANSIKKATLDSARESSRLVENLNPWVLPLNLTASTAPPVAFAPASVSPHAWRFEDPTVTPLGPAEILASARKVAFSPSANGTKTIAEAHIDSTLNTSNALPAVGTVVVKQVVADQVVRAQALRGQSPAMPTDGRDAGSVDSGEKSSNSFADQSIFNTVGGAQPRASSDNVAAPSSGWVSVSERVTVSPVVPGAPSSEEFATNSRQRWTVEPTSMSRTEQRGSSDDMKTAEPEATSKRVQALQPGTIVKPQSVPRASSTGAQMSGKTKSVGAGEPFATSPDAWSTPNLPAVADVPPMLAQGGEFTSSATGEQAVPMTRSLQTRTSPSPPVAATGKDAKTKRTANPEGPTDSVPQSAPAQSNVPAMPNVAVAASRSGVGSVAPVANSGLAGPAVHVASESMAVPVHTVSSAVPAGLNPASGYTGVRLDGGVNAELPAATQSGESHRTLLATPTALEVGVQSGSGTQGWLKIRAEVGGEGEVKASLDAVSATARDVLHSQLPALNAFLQAEQVPVTASVVERSAAPNGGTGHTALGSNGLRSADGSGTPNGSLLQSGGQRHADRHSNANGSEMVANYNSLDGVNDSAAAVSSALRVGISAESGRWLNVRV